MKVFAYDPKIEVIQATPWPNDIIKRACNTSLKGVYAEVFKEGEYTGFGSQMSQLLQFLLRAKHTSVLEHVFFTFDISQISRGCADQLRTHRMSSTTMSSTHYSDVGEYNHYVSREVLADESAMGALKTSNEAYNAMLALHPERRQILPLSTEVRILWTVNARSLMHFFELRMCDRNMEEMCLLANRLCLVCTTIWPELFSYANPPCVGGECNQGRMHCGRGSHDDE